MFATMEMLTIYLYIYLLIIMYIAVRKDLKCRVEHLIFHKYFISMKHNEYVMWAC
jgi:hypothetical protein